MSRPARVDIHDGPQVLHGVFPVSRETEERLKTHVDLLLRWQRAQNLVAPSTLGDVWRRHVADSLQVMRHVERARTFVDFGSGAGFPGVVIACLLMERRAEDPFFAAAHVHLVESNQRKAAFLRTVIRETGCPATVHAERIEAFAARRGEGFGEGTGEGAEDATVDVVTARALADLETLCGFAAPFSAAGARAIFHKGRNFREEVTQASHAWAFDLIEEESLIDPDSRILLLSDIRPLGATGARQGKVRSG
ncbi:16S rRNA (guanine(527)-N(7))-methyltransferase RsmG [Stappia sp.]|uniref:16S rRNA (guanine(527)-N(7))-methyltransferase RsmG n=1 Tax=Stappia sp. TaxID=1870903 RepID=UPI0032D936BD